MLFKIFSKKEAQEYVQIWLVTPDIMRNLGLMYSRFIALPLQVVFFNPVILKPK